MRASVMCETMPARVGLGLLDSPPPTPSGNEISAALAGLDAMGWGGDLQQLIRRRGAVECDSAQPGSGCGEAVACSRRPLPRASPRPAWEHCHREIRAVDRWAALQGFLSSAVAIERRASASCMSLAWSPVPEENSTETFALWNVRNMRT